MTPDAALAEINEHADPERATGAQAYHKADRTYLGVPNPVLNDLTKTWRQLGHCRSRLYGGAETADRRSVAAG